MCLSWLLFPRLRLNFPAECSPIRVETAYHSHCITSYQIFIFCLLKTGLEDSRGEKVYWSSCHYLPMFKPVSVFWDNVILIGRVHVMWHLMHLLLRFMCWEQKRSVSWMGGNRYYQTSLKGRTWVGCNIYLMSALQDEKRHRKGECWNRMCKIHVLFQGFQCLVLFGWLTRANSRKRTWNMA